MSWSSEMIHISVMTFSCIEGNTKWKQISYLIEIVKNTKNKLIDNVCKFLLIFKVLKIIQYKSEELTNHKGSK
jgi:hypothetical protein